MTDRADSGRAGPNGLLRDCSICCNHRNVADVTATLIPSGDLPVSPAPDGRIGPAGKPRPELRDELRRIPNLRNAVNIVVL